MKAMTKIILIALIIIFSMVPLSAFAQSTLCDETINALESAISGNLFFAFTTLKALGDAFESGAYTKVELDEMLILIDKIFDKIQSNLTKALNKYPEEQNNFIKDSIEAIHLLKKMKTSLNTYSEDKSLENYKSFIELQKVTWKKIKPLLISEG